MTMTPSAPNPDTAQAVAPPENYDHLDSSFAADPGPVWKVMREQCPMAHSDRYDGFWVPTRYDDVTAIAHDVETFSSARIVIPHDLFGPELHLPPITSDPPFHTKFRRLLLPTFSVKNMTAWEPATEDIANDLIDKFIDRAEFDGAREYSQLIPVTVIARMLGVDEHDRDQFTTWIMRLLDTGPNELADAQQAFIEQSEYLAAKIAEHHERRIDDVMTLLIETELDGERLDDNDLLGACQLLLIAGVDTTWSSIGSSIHHLATHPDDRRALVEALEDPEGEVWSKAVEEFLRAFSPVTPARILRKDIEMRGECLREGDQLLLGFPAANRDPAKFADPDTVRIDREDNRHYAFGVGRHRCLGSHLARMELRIGLQTLLRRVPEFSLADGASVRYAGGQVRGPREIPLVKPLSAAG